MALAAAVAFATPLAAWAQSAALVGVLGNKALLVVDGSEPRAVGPGETWRGVKVLSTQGNNAVLEFGGHRQTMRVGDAPVSVGSAPPSGAGRRVVLSASSDGHFVTQGTINSRPVQFLVDTGATAIGIGITDADRMGIKYRDGEAVQIVTANGVVRGWKVRLASVRLGDTEVHDVEAMVTPLSMPFVLLGNSYLTRFQMTRTNEQMVLEKRF